MHSSMLLIKLMLCDKGNELYIEIGKENVWAILFSRIILSTFSLFSQFQVA